MNPWLQRALISLAGSVVTTAVVVTTAKEPNKKKKKKKGKGKDGVQIEEEVPRSAGAQAAHDYRAGHDGGLSREEFIENVKKSGEKLRNTFSYLGGGLLGNYREGEQAEDDSTEGAKDPDLILEPGEEAPKRSATKRAKSKERTVRRGKRRKVMGRRRKPGEKAPPRKRKGRKSAKPKSDFEAIRDEAMKMAASKVVEKSGAGEVVENLKETGNVIKEKASALGEAISEKVPENFSEKASETFESAQKGFSEISKKVGATLKDAFNEHDWSNKEGAQNAVENLSSKVDENLASFSRWLDGESSKDDVEVIDAEVEDDRDHSSKKAKAVDAVIVDAVVVDAEFDDPKDVDKK